MAYLTKRFKKMVRRNGEMLKRDSSSKPKNYDLCHKCGKPVHFIKDCPLLKQEFSKNNPEKAAKRNLALVEWGDSSSESENETDAGDNSMMAVEGEENEYDSNFVLMAYSDDDEDDDSKEVNFSDVQRNLKSYSPKKLMPLASVLIDAYHSLVEDRDSLTLQIGEAEQTRDDLVVVVIDHKETIENFKEERNNLLVVIADLRETIERSETISKPGNSGKGKEIASEEHIRLENELKAVRTRMCVETEKNKHLQTDLERGIGFQREKTPYNPHSKCVIVSNNWLCTHCENNRHFKENCQARVQSVQKNKVFAKKGTVKRSDQQWFMDSGCSKHMTGNTMDFISLKVVQGGSVSFENGKNGYILGVRKVGKLLTHSIENVYYVNGLKYSLLSVPQICDKGNKVEFLSKICTVTDLVTGKLILVAKRYKNIYVADFKTKDETFEVFVAFVKKIQVKMESRVACIRSDYGTKFDNAKFDEFCNENGITHNFSALELLNKMECIIRSLLNKTPYELLNGRKPKLTHLRTFGCKCYVLNNGKDRLGKFDAKSDEGIFLRYSSQSKAYKIYNKWTQSIEESVHGIFDESYPFCEKNAEEDQDGEPLLVHSEVIDMANGNADMMSQVKELSEDNTISSSMEAGTSITTTKAEDRVVDVVQGTPLAPERRTQENQSNVPTLSLNEPHTSNWRHKSSYPLDNIITPLDSGLQTSSKARNSLAFSAFLSQIEPKNIKEALKDADWITAMQDELHQYERNNVWHLVPRPSDRTIIGTSLFQMDVKSAFMNGLLKEEVYVKQPPGFECHEHPEYVFKLDKALELLKRFDIEASKVINTPIATATRLDMNETRIPVNQTMYRGIIGSLLYLTASRPDIIFSVGLCASFNLIGYADADYAGYLVDRKSTSGMAHLLGACLISWGTRKQNSVALSIAEAKYVAAASCCAQLLWIKQQLENFRAPEMRSSDEEDLDNLDLDTLQAKVAYDSALQTSKKGSKKQRMKLVKDGVPVSDKVIPVVEVEEEKPNEPGSLVRQSQKKKQHASVEKEPDSVKRIRSEVSLDSERPRYQKVLLGRTFNPTISEMADSPKAYADKVQSFFASLFPVETTHICALVNRVDIVFDVKLLGEILKVSTVGVTGVKDVYQFNFINAVVKENTNQKRDQIHKKALLPVYQLLFELVNKVLLPRAERRSVTSKSDLFLMEQLDNFTLVSLPAIMIERMQKKRMGVGSTSTVSQLINAQNSAAEEIRRLKARNAILEGQQTQGVLASNDEVAHLIKENVDLRAQVENLEAELLNEQKSANARIDLVLQTLAATSKPSTPSAP
ncbi:uncharacterized protein [Nicotiana sylvestris]|uniref:uncharacterized protein n=1 Tax=Nicotiana sylvestris TaxID=4096 RepID=UPI00388C7AD4